MIPTSRPVGVSILLLVAAFNAARRAIEDLLEEQPLTPRAHEAAAYLARCYEIINDDGEKQRQNVDRCLGSER